jgi:hypothetical protein
MRPLVFLLLLAALPAAAQPSPGSSREEHIRYLLGIAPSGFAEIRSGTRVLGDDSPFTTSYRIPGALGAGMITHRPDFAQFIQKVGENARVPAVAAALEDAISRAVPGYTRVPSSGGSDPAWYECAADRRAGRYVQLSRNEFGSNVILFVKVNWQAAACPGEAPPAPIPAAPAAASN